MMARCVALDMDCAAICSLAVGAMARVSDHAKAICALCADICQACGDECAKHKHMQHCAECARDWREWPGGGPGNPWRRLLSDIGLTSIKSALRQAAQHGSNFHRLRTAK